MDDKNIIIIGAGFAGLCAGIYAQMNGYHSQIFEMHDIPGGLCTAWKRKGYTVDGCIHWLVGSSPKSGMYRYWQEVGLAQGREFVDLDEFMRYEAADGRTLVLYSDIDRLEKHLLEFAPQDAAVIKEFIAGIRMMQVFDPPSDAAPPLERLQKGLAVGWTIAARGREVQKWLNTTAEEFANRFQNLTVREALKEMWFPEFSMFFMLATFAWLHKRNAGYPIGGSLPMSLALAKRYAALGGQIHFKSRVAKILVAQDRAAGIQLESGAEHRAGRVISAADGYTTIFKMLDGKYADAQTREPYEKWKPFPPLIFVGVGVNRTFDDVPRTVSGFSYPLRRPAEIGERMHDRLSVRIFNQDPTLAPAGKTSLVVMMDTDYNYWKELAQDKAAYDEKKDQIARTVVELLEQRFPGIGQQVEMVDVSTPITFENFTGNWHGSFEGWLITPQNAKVVMKPMRQTLPGLTNFYMCGQWVEPGGGLPTGVMSARRLLQALCKEDKQKFVTTIA